MSHELVLYTKGKGKGLDDPLRRFTKRTVDYGSDYVRWLEDCLSRQKRRRFQRHYNYTKELVPPFAMPQNPYDGICPRFVHAAVNKNRSPVHVVTWFPHGRRVLTGTLAGEMTIWNGLQFHSENVMQAHNAGIKAMRWTPDESVMVSGDQLGFIKLWDQYIYNFQTFQGHKDSVCDIAIAPTGEKFCSCADDSHAKVWDLRTGDEERAFTGHGWDVKCCAWHPTKGLVATGSKDSQIKLWDPRASEAITTIFCHKNTVTQVAWSPSGQWLASASRDQLVMLMDVRTMSVRKVFKAHQKEVTSLCWHPENDGLLASGGYDGALHFWGTQGSSKPIESLPLAHEGAIWSLAWHPLGHLLVSGSNDYSTRFWSRARPGDSNFEQLLPKRVGLGATEATAVVEMPPAGETQEILQSGVFAELPWPPCSEERLAILNGTLALAPPPEPEPAEPVALAPEEPKSAEPSTPMVGLSLGEGPKAKNVLDTSDFDFESGVFAELPWPPCSEERLAILNGTLALAPPPEPEPAEPVALAPEEPKSAEPSTPMVGLSLGEGPKAKNVLDTSDFDFEEKTLEAKLKVPTKVEPTEEVRPKMAKVEPVEAPPAVLPTAGTAEAVTEAPPVAPEEPVEPGNSAAQAPAPVPAVPVKVEEAETGKIT